MRRSPLLALVSVLVIACTTGGRPTPTPLPSPTPAPFTIDVLPPEEPAAVRAAIPGQNVCFLIVIIDDGGSPKPATVTASATGAMITSIEPSAELVAGTVGEVWVVPDPSTVEATAHVTFTATRDGISQTVERSLPVFPMVDERARDARPYFDRWLAFLIAEHPELGITDATAWKPEFVSTLLIVSTTPTGRRTGRSWCSGTS